MTYRELFENALRAVAEGSDTGEVSDYEERAGYLLATFCMQCAKADADYRRANGEDAATFSVAAWVDPDDEFPLCDVFAPPAIYYLSAMLTLDENEEMSDRFFELYSDALSKILSSLPAACEGVTDRYKIL